MTRIFCFAVCCMLLCGRAGAQGAIDKKATPETKALLHNLKANLQRGVYFGHQDALAYGVNWRYQPGRSDVKEVSGDYPAVYGWEIGHIELDKPHNLDSVPFNQMKKFIAEGYGRGGIITISWHLDNPFNGKSSWDNTKGSVASILPGGDKHELFKTWLDKVAAFMLDLKGSRGELIPILFRPWHEHTGNWFWWGKEACTPEEYKQLFRITVDYLRDTKGVHNLLYVYNTDRFSSREAYMERYPGDDYVDVVSFDSYYRDDNKREDWVKDIRFRLGVVNEIAMERGKLPAFSETGFNAIPDSSWWTGAMLEALKEHPASYVMVWRNHGWQTPQNSWHYYAPYPGQVSAPDFVRFVQSPRILMEQEAKAAQLYRNKKQTVKTKNR